MAARSGSEFLERLSAARVHVEIQGETLIGRPGLPRPGITARRAPISGNGGYYRSKLWSALADGGDMSKGTVFLFLWLIIGAAAAGQRGYFSAPNLGCTQGATMALTIVAGPLNYVGLDPKISCTTPKPSGS